MTDRDTVRGIITAAHCTVEPGVLNGAVVFQPVTRRIGMETIDPAFFTGGACPAGRICRRSDAAYIDLDDPIASALGRIARTRDKGWNQIDHANTSFRIVSDTPGPLMGSSAHKVGITSGWTQGNVNELCLDVNDPASNRTFLCQVRAEYSSGPGDSGGPVFKILDTPLPGDVEIFGVTFATLILPGSGQVYGIFSQIGDIQNELGPSSVWNNCDPVIVPTC